MKKNKFPYRKGSIIEIFIDYQTCRVYEGMGRLLKLVSNGLPFILEETKKSDEQIVYSYQVWLVDIDGFRTHRKIRYVRGIGDYASLSEERVSPLPKDKFIKINNKEVY
jgi:hypothetical protein